MSEHRAERLTGFTTAYRDSKVTDRMLQGARQSLQFNLLPGEVVLGFFASTRLRRSITMLLVTDRRLLTLGELHVGMPVVDEVDRADVITVHIEREKIFTTGLVRAETADGEVNLGTLTYGSDTFFRLDEVLSHAPARRLPVIPTSGPGMPNEPPPDGLTPADGDRGGQRSTHPLVLHLTALADLHERGALNDEEFAAAKARLLADPQGDQA